MKSVLDDSIVNEVIKINGGNPIAALRWALNKLESSERINKEFSDTFHKVMDIDKLSEAHYNKTTLEKVADIARQEHLMLDI